jgi:hypothetical protein
VKLRRLPPVLLGGIILANTVALAQMPSGNNTLPVPPGAQAAGYTTLAMNSDWTTQIPANWLGGCTDAGNGSPVNLGDTSGHDWWMNIWWSENYQPCLTAQVTDPSSGGLALDIPWIVDPSYANVGAVIQSSSWNYGSPGYADTNVSFPIGSYYEIAAMMVPASTPGAYFVANTWGEGGIHDQDCGCAIEWDVMEISGGLPNRSDSAVHNWGAGGQGAWILYPWENFAPSTNFVPTQYNVYGLLVTYDADTQQAEGCTYINDVFQKCASLPGGVTSAEASTVGRQFLVIQNACDWWNEPNGQCTPTAGLKQDLLIREVRVWSCSSWQTTQCSGPLVTAPATANPPPPPVPSPPPTRG